MSALKTSIAQPEDVRKAIIHAHNSGDASIDWPLINALTHDYQKWFHEIMNAVDVPEKRNDAPWRTEGEPCWILVSNETYMIVGYASLLLSHKVYLSVQQGRVTDVVIKEDEDMLQIIPLLRKAVDDLLWFHWLHQEETLKKHPKSLKKENYTTLF